MEQPTNMYNKKTEGLLEGPNPFQPTPLYLARKSLVLRDKYNEKESLLSLEGALQKYFKRSDRHRDISHAFINQYLTDYKQKPSDDNLFTLLLALRIYLSGVLAIEQDLKEKKESKQEPKTKKRSLSLPIELPTFQLIGKGNYLTRYILTALENISKNAKKTKEIDNSEVVDIAKSLIEEIDTTLTFTNGTKFLGLKTTLSCCLLLAVHALQKEHEFGSRDNKIVTAYKLIELLINPNIPLNPIDYFNYQINILKEINQKIVESRKEGVTQKSLKFEDTLINFRDELIETILNNPVQIPYNHLVEIAKLITGTATSKQVFNVIDKLEIAKQFYSKDQHQYYSMVLEEGTAEELTFNFFKGVLLRPLNTNNQIRNQAAYFYEIYRGCNYLSSHKDEFRFRLIKLLAKYIHVYEANPKNVPNELKERILTLQTLVYIWNCRVLAINNASKAEIQFTKSDLIDPRFIDKCVIDQTIIKFEFLPDDLRNLDFGLTIQQIHQKFPNEELRANQEQYAKQSINELEEISKKQQLGTLAISRSRSDSSESSESETSESWESQMSERSRSETPSEASTPEQHLRKRGQFPVPPQTSTSELERPRSRSEGSIGSFRNGPDSVSARIMIQKPPSITTLFSTSSVGEQESPERKPEETPISPLKNK